MATIGDPWKLLGLAPGANLEEVRRAYRRLAKVNHPDAAGEGALPRFLAIQAAYEQIVGARRARRPGSRPGAAGGAGAAESAGGPSRDSWRADPDRTRASGRADGRRPGARPTGRPAGAPGAAGSGSGATGAPPSGGPTGAGSRRAGGSSTGAGSGAASGRGRRSSKRTPYSTSYDAADEEPFEPGWSGGTWYGASSGTYWTINPKEYADPRKHGPEYQARARRAAAAGGAGWILDDEGDPQDETTPRADEPDPDREDPRSGPAAARAEPASARAAPERPTADRARPQPARQRPPAATPPPPARPGAGAATTQPGFHGPVLPRPSTPFGRLAIALLGWPPLALFAGSAIGESTGCGRYAASCSELSSPGTWILSVAILLLLLALPVVARWSAHGTIALLVIGVPSAVILSAAGGTNVPSASAPLMLGVPRLSATG
jgi:curved DNA-binding protein CbpA